jgi:hypothetical protein
MRSAKATDGKRQDLTPLCSWFVVVSLLAGQVATVRAFAARVAVQAAGGWIAAIGLFMLG